MWKCSELFRVSSNINLNLWHRNSFEGLIITRWIQCILYKISCQHMSLEKYMYIWTTIFVNDHFHVSMFTTMTGCFYLFSLLIWFTRSSISPAFPRWGECRQKQSGLLLIEPKAEWSEIMYHTSYVQGHKRYGFPSHKE